MTATGSWLNVATAETGSRAASFAMTGIPVDKVKSVAYVATVTNSAPAAGAFTAAVTDICTKAAHTFLTGLKVQLTTTTTLPAGLALATDYFVIYLSANTFSLASSLVLAQAGTAIDITDTGTGVHTITPAALAGASIKLQGSMDNTTYVDLPIKATGDATKSSSITATASVFLGETDVCVNYVRTYVTLTAGQLAVSQIAKVSTKN